MRVQLDILTSLSKFRYGLKTKSIKVRDIDGDVFRGRGVSTYAIWDEDGQEFLDFEDLYITLEGEKKALSTLVTLLNEENVAYSKMIVDYLLKRR